MITTNVRIKAPDTTFCNEQHVDDLPDDYGEELPAVQHALRELAQGAAVTAALDELLGEDVEKDADQRNRSALGAVGGLAVDRADPLDIFSDDEEISDAAFERYTRGETDGRPRPVGHFNTVEDADGSSHLEFCVTGYR